MHLGLILGVFAVIFLAELPDKTMIATLIMGSRSRPLLVWIGVTAAFGVHAALAVVAGRLIALLPHTLVEAITALLFAGGAAYLLLVSEEEEVIEGVEEVAEAPRGLKPIATAFVVIFIGEFGDLTQILTVNLAAKYHQPLAVFIGAFAALAAVGAIGAFGGRALSRFIPLGVIRKIGGVLLAGFAIYSLVVLFTG